MVTHAHTYMLSQANCQSYDRAGLLQGDMGPLQHTQFWHHANMSPAHSKKQTESMLSEKVPCSGPVPCIAARLVLAAASFRLYIVSLKNTIIKILQAPQPEHIQQSSLQYCWHVCCLCLHQLLSASKFNLHMNLCRSSGA